MPPRPLMKLVLTGVFATVTLLAAPLTTFAQGQTIYGLVQGANTLVRFNSSTPGTIAQTIAVTGVLTGETLRGIDFRPLTGQLHGIATDAAGAQVRLYAIDPATGVATAAGPVVTAPVPGLQWGMSFNPAVDRIRLVNGNGENLRTNPLTAGTLAGDDANLTSPGGGTPSVDAVAYDRQFAGTAQTTLFAINRATNSLATQGGVNGMPSPNLGGIVDIGPLGVTLAAGAASGLDMTTTGVLFASLTATGGSTGLYRVNPTSGAATLVGTIGAGSDQIDDLAIVEPTIRMTPDSGTYTSRQRFDLVLLLDLVGRGLVNGVATFDGINVTPILVSCLVGGAGPSGLLSLRCPNLGGPAVGPGAHVLDVTLFLGDGSQIRRSVTWTVLPVTEP